MKIKFLIIIFIISILSSCDIPREITPISGTYEEVTCERGCGGDGKYYITKELCEQPDKFINDLRKDADDRGLNNDSVYNSGNGTAFHGLWDWGTNVTTGMGRTAWWKAYAKYCQDKGYFTSNYNNIQYGNTGKDGNANRLTIVKSEKGEHKATLLGKKDNDYISIQGTQNTTEKTIKSPTFNSPFIYFSNQPVGNITININSEWNEYSSVNPNFNIKNGWNVHSDGKNIDINGEKEDNLFYELAVKKIDLSRNGQNFNSKDKLIDFLKNGNFYNKLGFDKNQKEDSLSYILPKIKDSANYYLTVLDDNSINNISKLNIDPKPENLVRKYFAIYPTELPVKTYGDIKYPKTKINTGYTVNENGEFYIDNNMIVLWNN